MAVHELAQPGAPPRVQAGAPPPQQPGMAAGPPPAPQAAQAVAPARSLQAAVDPPHDHGPPLGAPRVGSLFAPVRDATAIAEGIRRPPDPP